MLVGQEIKEGGDAEEHVEDVTAGDNAQGDDTAAHGEVLTVTQEPSIPSPTPPTPSPQHLKISHQHPSLLQEALVAFASLTKRVERLENDKVAQALEITKLKKSVKKLEKGNKDDDIALMDDKEKDKKDEEAKVVDIVTTAKLITEVVTAASEIVTTTSIIIATVEPFPAATITATPAKVDTAPNLEEESTTSSIIPVDTKSKDKGKGIMVEEPKPLKKKEHIEMDEEYARKLDYFKGMSYDDIRPIFEAKFNSNVDFLLKTNEQMEEEDNRALQKINETPAKKAAKRRKLNKEVEDLKRYLEIVPDEDDDVYTEATPLARKVPVVDYKITEINNKPYYKII
nr:hypothetical protein [Tanacetum cinerariifolium]